MSKKRRMFDIDMPADALADEPVAETKSQAQQRRGPMAAAIVENSESLQARSELEASIRAENDALAHEFVRLKELGLMVDLIALDDIETTKLQRDRATDGNDDLSELKASISSIGLSNPIRVEARSDGKYELIQGFRRLSAFRALLEETGEGALYSKIPAGIENTGESIDTLYRKMVDENLVRKDISFSEMANLAMRFAADPSTETQDPDKAVAVLFKSANYQKRSYIRNFIRFNELLGDILVFPQDVSRALGLAVVSKLTSDPSDVATIKAALGSKLGRKPQAELSVLRQFVGDEFVIDKKKPLKNTNTEKGPRQAKITFDVPHKEGNAKCTASAGRLEIKFPKDFSGLNRRSLEKALGNLLDELF